MKPKLLFAVLCLFAAHASAAEWTSAAGQAKVHFTAINNGTPVKGTFTDVKAALVMDEAAPEKNRLHAEIATGVIAIDYEDVSAQLRLPEWLDVDAHKTAVFDATHIAQGKGNQYEAHGNLTLRGVTKPVTLAFTWDVNGNTATLKGNTTLSRTAFGVGQGQWSKTDVVADDVAINVEMVAKASAAPTAAIIPPSHDMAGMQGHAVMAASASGPIMKLTSKSPLQMDQPNRLLLDLSNAAGTPLPPGGLQEVHTQKLHLLVVDATLTDYQHLHPKAGPAAGHYETAFTPRTPYNYHVWADVTLVGGPQAYLAAEIAGKEPVAPKPAETIAMDGANDGLIYTLAFDHALKAGRGATGTVHVTDADGKPFAQLEPVMGAFAHIVGFSADGKHLAHMHPMGKEPVTETERGGPDVAFMITPEVQGFMKLFLQVRIGGTDRFIPFGVMVQG